MTKSPSLLLTVAAAVAIVSAHSTSAWAADVRPAAPPAAVPPVIAPPVIAPPAFTWSGFYLGADIGVGVADWDANTSFIAVLPGTTLSNSATFPGPDQTETSVLVGLHAGYGLQFGSFLIGVEGDISLLGSGANQRYNIPAAVLVGANLGAIIEPPDGFESVWTREIEWLATARARLGLIVRPGLLVFVTGGLAAADVSSRVGFIGLVDRSPAVLVPVSARHSETRTGFAIGGGVEALLASDLSVKFEYLYADLGRMNWPIGTYLDTPCCVQNGFVREEITVQTARIGFSYRFSSY